MYLEKKSLEKAKLCLRGKQDQLPESAGVVAPRINVMTGGIHQPCRLEKGVLIQVLVFGRGSEGADLGK